MKNIVLFASGNGSNAENICRYFEGHPRIRVAALFCNNPSAGVIGKMKAFEVPVTLFNRGQFSDPDFFLPLLQANDPDLIVLAGFLWLLPEYLVHAFRGRIVNIHPALLPKFGGKGMYGHHVHEAVLKAGEKEHGITVHHVNERFDEGTIIFREAFDLTENDDVKTISKRIAELEQQHFPIVIERLLEEKV